MLKNKIKSKIKEISVWDYDFKKNDLKNPALKTWYLNRKINFGDFENISKKDLKKCLPSLSINTSMKELLTNYLRHVS